MVQGILIHVILVKVINVYFHNFMLIIVFENMRVLLTLIDMFLLCNLCINCVEAFVCYDWAVLIIFVFVKEIYMCTRPLNSCYFHVNDLCTCCFNFRSVRV